MADTLAKIACDLAFGALPVEAVLALREGTAWRRFTGGAPDRFRPLLSVADLDAFLLTAGARVPRIAMADSARQGGAGLPEEEYALPNGLVDPMRVFARFDAGATLIASQLQEVHAPLARFCRGLEQLFLHGMQANAYLTPPGAQGFRPHYDTHDVLVLQVEGEKLWRVWPHQPVPHPTGQTPFRHDIPLEGEPESFVLREGEALYLPRGVVHDAQSQVGDHSLHLTIGFLEPSWADALRLLLDRREQEDARLRAPFPSWRLGEEAAGAALLEELAARLAGLAGEAALEAIGLGLLEGLADQRLPLPARGLLSPPPGPETALRLSDAMLHHVAALPDGSAQLCWAGGRLALGARELGWVQALADGASPAMLGEGAMAFCRRLWAVGLLEG
ncbi:cupin domain-containing protein [Siccirubricoccus sp. KC 17139]|uniref:Cupin domain-containing protein n=1 Tax=Siccirubricoccus soli TaxID=2899147 RepID=A0ABT1DBP3_9PROT|nr:cupin domain-containing protein [Siccirubricoccus soli]MCO6419349.1 cupin domain-containing protein [Siccirubricoccus soli]MCP2685484.1 cupin domain-containing protein [Siccirubricoccus soli]